jgi:hypothetical protein
LIERSPLHIARITAIASSSAATASAGARRGPPIATIASQNAPAPSPSCTRPPVRRSSEAADFASIAGGRSGSVATVGTNVIRSVRPAR